jgi:hypothetical protein
VARPESPIELKRAPWLLAAPGWGAIKAQAEGAANKAVKAINESFIMFFLMAQETVRGCVSVCVWSWQRQQQKQQQQQCDV